MKGLKISNKGQNFGEIVELCFEHFIADVTTITHLK